MGCIARKYSLTKRHGVLFQTKLNVPVQTYFCLRWFGVKDWRGLEKDACSGLLQARSEINADPCRLRCNVIIFNAQFDALST